MLRAIVGQVNWFFLFLNMLRIDGPG